MDKSAVDEQYPYVDDVTTLTEKDWAGGSEKLEACKELIIPAKAGDPIVIPMEYAPRLPKLVDEVVVNALDHVVRSIGGANPVTEVNIAYNAGTITVYNNGTGIPVAKHETASLKEGYDVYVPELIMGILFQGSNKERDANCIIGGTNGIGAKLANANSVLFTIETYDDQRGFYYSQTWVDRMKRTPPKIEKLTARHRRGTTITFTPDYALLGMGVPLSPVDSANIGHLVRHRAITACVYANYACTNAGRVRPPVVKWCGAAIACKRVEDIAAALFPDSPRVIMQIRATDMHTTSGALTASSAAFRLPWTACVVHMPASISKLEYDNLSCINGIIARGGGHIARVRDIVSKVVCECMTSRIAADDMKRAKKRVNERTFIVLYCQIPNPGWDGQRKDKLSFGKGKFAHYVIDSKTATAVGGMLADAIVADIQGGASKQTAASGKIVVRIPPDIYTPCNNVGNARVKGKMLIVTEGLSPKISVDRNGIDRERFGTFALRGVIVNARRETDTVETGDDSQYVIPNAKFKNNKILQYYIAALGLDDKKQYHTADMAAAAYDTGVLFMTDQDLDGKGCILGLLLSMMAHLWPGLYAKGYIKWFETPIIRAFPKKVTKATPGVIAFYSVDHFKAWADEDPKRLAKYNIVYYKGLARHEKSDWKAMFATIAAHTYTYIYDTVQHPRWFDIYFGDSPDKRKVILRRAPMRLTEGQSQRLRDARVMPCDIHLRTETDAYQRDNLERKLPHVVDGQNQSGRKIIHCAIRHMLGKPSIRVVQFSGLISKEENYHHGEASLDGGIFYRMQCYPGAAQLPPLVPRGESGSRYDGGQTHGSNRYVHVSANSRLLTVLFPETDYNMLEFNYEEGARCEPKYFVPIVPLAICESMRIPATGWTLGLWARDLHAIVNVVRTRIAYNSTHMESAELPPYEYKNAQVPWLGHCGIDESYGCYEIISRGSDCETVLVTELPLRRWTWPYIKEMTRLVETQPDVFLSVRDNSEYHVKITICLAPGTIARVAEEHASEHRGLIALLRLRAPMQSYINMMEVDGSVGEYVRYIDVLNTWYPYRRNMYIARVQRQTVMYELQIAYYENIVRYIGESASLDISRKPLAYIIERLRDAGFVRYYSDIVKNPGFTPTDQIRALATESDKATYDYLIDLSDRNKSAESLKRYEETLGKLRDAYAAHVRDCTAGAFPGAVQWIRELDELMTIYAEGCLTEWHFGESAANIPYL